MTSHMTPFNSVKNPMTYILFWCMGACCAVEMQPRFPVLNYNARPLHETLFKDHWNVI